VNDNATGWCRLIPVQLPKVQRGSFEASPEQCRALAQRFDLLAVDAFRFDYVLSRQGRGDIWRLKGTVTGQVVQACVVTLAPVSGTVDEAFDCLCATEDALSKRVARQDDADGLSLDGEDTAEIPDDGTLDVSEVAIQYWGLGINPYPRVQG
jgi:uncharacterized metal-binding protein YceD (DUF177 family)